MLPAYLSLALGALSLGFSAIFVRWAAAPGAVTGFYRLAIALVLLAPIFARDASGRPRPTRRALGLALLAGLLFAGDLAAWNTAVLMTTAANATLLANTAPLWVGLGSWLLLRRRLGGGFWMGLLLALAGTALISGADFLLHPTRVGRGDLLALLAGLFYGGFYLATELARRELSSLQSFWLAGLSSAGALLLLALLLGDPLSGYPQQTWLNFLALGVLTQGLGYLAINFALGRLPASLVSPTLLVQPVLTALLAIPLLGEGLAGYQMLGGAAILAGIWLVHGSGRPPPAPPAGT